MTKTMLLIAMLSAAALQPAHAYDPSQFRPLTESKQYKPDPLPTAPTYGYPAQPGYGQPRGGQYGYPQAQPQYGYPGQQYGRPQYGQQQYGYPGQYQYSYPSQQKPAANKTGVRMEVELMESEAYAYQNLILTLDVVSGVNLSTLEVTLPQTDAFIFKSLGERTAAARGSDDNREIVTREQYLLIPLRAGDFDLDALSAKGRTSTHQDFDIRPAKSIKLKIKPPEPGIQPWLPLEKLTLNANLTNEVNLKLGKPASLVLEMSAIGFTGAQLPSFEKQLKSAGLRTYREKTENEGKLKADGKLYGKRVEHYTLLPGEDEQLFLPSIKVQWWNLEKSRAETTLLPMRVLGDNRHRTTRISSEDPATSESGFSWYFWAALIFIAFLAGIFWSVIWNRGKVAGERFGKHFLAITEPIRKATLFWLQKLSPRRHMHRIRRFIADSLPRSWRLWYCVRVADSEDDPEFWLQVLRFLAERRLGIPPQISLHRLAGYIVDIHPRSDADQMYDLLQQLDAAIFGNRPLDDFKNWKRLFKKEIRPRLIPFSRKKGTSQRPGLPALNP